MSMTVVSSADLQAVLNQHQVSVPEEAHQPLIDYCLLLWDWNSQVNLTRHTDMQAFVCRDLIDTLRLAQHIPSGSSVLDVGSGGGVPGIPLAILRPDLKITLAESVTKKAKVLKSMVRDLHLPVNVSAERAEKMLKTQAFDVLTIRAVAPLRKLLFWFRQYPDHFGRLLIIKGPRWVQELETAQEENLVSNLQVEKIDDYPTPGHDSNSVILSVTFQAHSA